MNREKDNSNLDNLIVEAYAQEREKASSQMEVRNSNLGIHSKVSIHKDKDADIKKSLIKTLNEKATNEDIELLKQLKTNKEDFEMQMKCMDIMHK